ncbi:MAG: hypothetical protein ACREBE_11485 [bacterium]
MSDAPIDTGGESPRISRANAEKEIRSVGRTCRGPHVRSTAVVVAALMHIALEDRAKRAAFLANSKNDAADAPAGRLGDDADASWCTPDYAKALAELPTAAAVATSLLHDGHTVAASLVDNVARAKACGADFNDIVCAGPLDGQPHEYKCPKCGVTGTYNAPLYEIAAVENVA